MQKGSRDTWMIAPSTVAGGYVREESGPCREHAPKHGEAPVSAPTRGCVVAVPLLPKRGRV